jgi:hypothetical protein
MITAKHAKFAKAPQAFIPSVSSAAGRPVSLANLACLAVDDEGRRSRGEAA